MKVGMKFYYTGNMTNAPGVCEVVEVLESDLVVTYKNNPGHQKKVPKCLVDLKVTDSVFDSSNKWMELDAYKEYCKNKFGDY